MAVYQRPITATDVLSMAAAVWSRVWSISWSEARRPIVVAASWRDN